MSCSQISANEARAKIPSSARPRTRVDRKTKPAAPSGSDIQLRNRTESGRQNRRRRSWRSRHASIHSLGSVCVDWHWHSARRYPRHLTSDHRHQVPHKWRAALPLRPRCLSPPATLDSHPFDPWQIVQKHPTVSLHGNYSLQKGLRCDHRCSKPGPMWACAIVMTALLLASPGTIANEAVPAMVPGRDRECLAYIDPCQFPFTMPAS